MNADVLFVHAVQAPSGRVLRMKVNRAYARLSSEIDRAMKGAEQESTVAVRLGRPLEVLIDTAREYRPDLIVMARPRRRRLDFLIGTTAERVIRRTECSVLIVGDAAEGSYERVLLASDLSSAATRVAHALAELRLLDNADAHAVHAFHLPHHTLASSADTFAAAVYEHRFGNRNRRDVLRILRSAGIDANDIQVITERAPPLSAIQRAINRVRPQLVVIGVSRWFALKRLLIGSVADQVFRSVDCDILAVGPKARAEVLQAA
jgi:nucleotide-binding universal stress UspA family protein